MTASTEREGLRERLQAALDSDYDWEDREAMLREIVSTLPRAGAGPSSNEGDGEKP